MIKDAITSMLLYDITKPFKRAKRYAWWQTRKPLRLRILEYNKKHK